MLTTRLLIIGFMSGLFAVAACSPATSYNKGIEMSYHPSGKADAQQKLVSSAIELKQDADQKTIKDVGGVYLGELEVLAARTQDFSSGAGGKSLGGRVSLEAATRGATHFYMTSSSVEHSVQQASGPRISLGGVGTSNAEAVNKTRVRYVLFRVEMPDWSKLPKEYLPEATAEAKASAAAAPAASPAATVATSPAAPSSEKDNKADKAKTAGGK